MNSGKERLMIAMEHIVGSNLLNKDKLLSKMVEFKELVDEMFFYLDGKDMMEYKALYDDLSALLFSARCVSEEIMKDSAVEKEILPDETTV